MTAQLAHGSQGEDSHEDHTTSKAVGGSSLQRNPSETGDRGGGGGGGEREDGEATSVCAGRIMGINE